MKFIIHLIALRALWTVSFCRGLDLSVCCRQTWAPVSSDWWSSAISISPGRELYTNLSYIWISNNDFQTYLFCKKEMSIFSGSRYYRPCFLGYDDRNLAIEMSNTPAYLWCDNYLKMCLPSPSLGWRVCRVPVCHHQKFLMVMVKLPAGGTTMRDARATLDLAGLCQQVCNTLQYNYHTSYQPSLEASV